MIYSTLSTLIDRLDRSDASTTGVIPWGSPVPSFGDPSTSLVASLGLNPSNREFVDLDGVELEGSQRRFHTLRSLRVSRWSEIDASHLRLIRESCWNYFHGNPYNGWFRRLEFALSSSGSSFYGRERTACHLDLIPYATAAKWASLPRQSQDALLETGRDTLGLLIRDSRIEVLVLNGQGVVTQFLRATGASFEERHMPSWNLQRSSGRPVRGTAYVGMIHTVGDISLGRQVLVLGYNHNLQSSFGVTTDVMTRIRNWIGRMVSGSSR